MHEAVSHLLPLAGLTFLLGLRHGMDPDHLAVVDNLTRYNAGKTPDRARWCGLWFSLGHGAMVSAVAALLAIAASARQIPAWVETTGNLVSIVFLLLIGALNLLALRRSAPGEPVAPRGLRTGWLARTTQVSHPLLISLIGAAFAISMDTMSQAAVFSLAASGEFAWGIALLLGLIFTLGMLAVDAANGLWVYRLIASSAQQAQVWSRRLTFTIALLSLGLAAFGIVRLSHQQMDAWYDSQSLALGLACTLVLGLVWCGGRITASDGMKRSSPPL